MSEHKLFKKYLTLIKDVYENSTLKEKNWYYSLSSTPLYKNGIVLCGLNWGVSSNHSAQEDYPKIDFLDIQDLGSFGRMKQYIETHIPKEDQKKIVQINCCFFRTENESQLTKDDIKSNKEIFISLIKELQPKVFIASSRKILDILDGNIENKTETQINNGIRKIKIYKGNLAKDLGDSKFMYIPHPNYPMTSAARKEAWKFGFGNEKF